PAAAPTSSAPPACSPAASSLNPPDGPAAPADALPSTAPRPSCAEPCAQAAPASEPSTSSAIAEAMRTARRAIADVGDRGLAGCSGAMRAHLCHPGGAHRAVGGNLAVM